MVVLGETVDVVGELLGDGGLVGVTGGCGWGEVEEGGVLEELVFPPLGLGGVLLGLGEVVV